MIGRSFEVYPFAYGRLTLPFESFLAIELYLRRQLFRDGGFRDLLRLPRLTVATLPRALLPPITIITTYLRITAAAFYDLL